MLSKATLVKENIACFCSFIRIGWEKGNEKMGVE